MKKNQKFSISYEVFKLDSIFGEAEKLITEFNNINDIPIKELIIKLDFNTPYYGYYFFETKYRKCTIYINPKNCYLASFTGQNKKSSRHPEDLSLVNVITHEYCHFLEHIFKLRKEYEEMPFEEKHLYLNFNSTIKGEELVEILTMYIHTPYLLKIIGSDRFDWVSRKFKTPSTCSKKAFFDIYKQWDEVQKNYVIEKYSLDICEIKNTIKKKTDIQSVKNKKFFRNK
jgi:hypothetical protein